MVNAINSAITAKAVRHRGLPRRPEGVQRPDRPGAQARIPVLATTPTPQNNRLAYIGQDLYLSGYEMGQRIVDLVGSGDVALFIATPGQLNIQPRIDGAKAAIKQFGKGKIKTPRRSPPARSSTTSWRRSTRTTSVTRTSRGCSPSTPARRRASARSCRSTASRRRASRPAATTWGRPILKLIHSGPPGLHDRPAALLAGLAPRPPALLLQVLVRARCAVGHEHRHPVRDEGQREAVPDDEDALPRQLQQAEVPGHPAG